MFLPDQEVQETQIVNFEIKNGDITLQLSKSVEKARFYLNGNLVEATSEQNNTYKIDPTPVLQVNKEYTLRVSDEQDSFEEIKTFTYRNLVAPTEVTTASSLSNEKGEINASNVNSATILAKLTENKTSVNLDVIIKDSGVGEKQKTLTLTKKLTGFETEWRFEGIDLSSLADGTLNIEAIVKDEDGNVASKTYTITKRSDTPIVKYVTVDRTGAKTISLKSITSKEDDYLYYLVKEIGEPAPTVDEVLKNGTKNTNNSKERTLNITINNGEANKAYVVYLASTSKTGTKSTSAVPVNVAKIDAPQLKKVEDLNLKSGTKATVIWGSQYDENQAGFIGYKVILKKSSSYLAEETVEKGNAKEVNFFDIIKKEGSGSYTVSVIALANNADYESSIESTKTVSISVNPVISSNSTTPTVTGTLITWQNIPTISEVPDISGYNVKVEKYDKNEVSNYRVITVDSRTETYFDLASIIEKNGIGEYKVTVTANAKEDILKADKTFRAVKCYKADAISLAVDESKVKTNSVTLTATLLPENLYSDTPTYKVYYEKDKAGYDGGSIVTKTSFPYSKTSLNTNTKYNFKLEVTIGSYKFVSEPISVTTLKEPTAIATTAETTFMEYVKTSDVDPKAKLEADNQITFNGETLYLRNSTNVVAYTAEDNPVVLDIISVLKQLTGGKDKLTIKNSKITTLKLTAKEVGTDKAYDLLKVPEDATVTVIGNKDHKTTIKGKLNAITLDTESNVTKPKFDLSGLTVKTVTVKDDEYNLTVANGTKLTFVSGKTKAIVNNVSLSQETKLSDVRVTSEGFEFTGSSKKITVDATNVNKDIVIKLIGAQTGLDITSSNVYAVKVVSLDQTVTNLAVKKGIIDLTDENTTFAVVTAGDATDSEVILVTKTTANATVQNRNIIAISKQENPDVEGFEYKFYLGNVEDIASWSTSAQKTGIKLTITGGDSVKIEK